MRLSEQQIKFLKMVTQLLNHFIPIIEAMDMGIKVTEWNRTIEQQKQYVAEGSSKTLHSKHLIGLAVDLAIIDNGKFLRKHQIYEKMGAYWESLGGTWGGRWTFGDVYHFEYGEDK